jgi:tetratricopeptide (TPR) repeat protein
VALLRAIKGWRQEDLARAAGTKKSAVCSVEGASRGFSFENVAGLVEAMGWPLSVLADMIEVIRRVRTGKTERSSLPADLVPAAPPIGYPLSRAADLPRAAARLLASELPGRGARSETAGRTPRDARERARRLWERLEPYGTGERQVVVREAPEFQTWALAELLCAESERAAAHDAGAAIALADLAVEIALVAPEEERWRRRLEGHARAFAANALRAASRPGAAAEAFERALEVWESGAPADPYPLDGSRLLDLEASLRRDQRRLDESLALLDRALDAHPTGRDAGRLLIKKAQSLEVLGDYEGAVATLYRAVPELDPEGEPRLAFIQRVNLALDLGYVGRAVEAEDVLAEARALGVRLGNRLDLLRVRWVEGILAGKLGRTTDAMAAFGEVRDGFVGLAMPYDAALATMELAALHAAEGGRAAEVKALAAQAGPIFAAEEVHEEARKAFAVFQRAAAEERVTVELARALAAYLQRARHEPGMRFEAGA